jgi:hypothetical protein
LKKEVAIIVFWHKFWAVEGLTEIEPVHSMTGATVLQKILSSKDSDFSGLSGKAATRLFFLQIII